MKLYKLILRINNSEIETKNRQRFIKNVVEKRGIVKEVIDLNDKGIFLFFVEDKHIDVFEYLLAHILFIFVDDLSNNPNGMRPFRSFLVDSCSVSDDFEYDVETEILEIVYNKEFHIIEVIKTNRN